MSSSRTPESYELSPRTLNGERENTKIVIGLVAPPLVGQMVDMEPASTPAVLAPMPGALEGGLPALPPLRSAEIILWGGRLSVNRGGRASSGAGTRT